MKIELTDQQEQAVKQGRPVEIVDPASERTFVVIARELYDGVHPPSAASPAAPISPAAAASHGEVKPQRVRLNELPTPPEVVAEAKECCRKYGWQQRGVEEELKLQYYFGGQSIYLLRTPEGLVVIPIEERYKGTPGLRDLLLTPAEKYQAVRDCPSPWNDTVSQILSS